eukprot:XP_001702661.1 predicted protein [Chlamydomonas reinhardtii]
MQWLPCSAASHDAGVTTARFGHSAVTISGAGSVWGTDLVVVFGGVSYSDGEASLEHHAALSDVVVLQSELQEQGMWFAPQCTGVADDHGGEPAVPDARAFHAAAAVDRRMYVFGGHVLSFDADQNKKRRRFFNDLWCLDTSGRVAGDAWVLDLQTHTWSQLRIPGPTPPPRKMHAAVFATNRVVIFGGERDAGVLDDLWTLKGVDGSEPAKWTQIRLRPAPSGRFGHAMAACGSRLAVFGGCLDQSSLLSFSRNYVQCNELWHRVEPPDGVAAVSGAALDDPQLHHHLDMQQQQAPGASPPLLLLPVERMCHSLVGGGAGEGRLLLVGGRKRDGICAESCWGRGSVSMSGNTAGVGSSSGLGNSASGAALDAASTSAFILPGQQQQEPLHMAGSKSAGSLVDPAPAPGVSGSGLMLPAGLGSPGGAASLLAATSAKERITDKASTALNRLTTKVSNLLTPTKDAAGSPGAGGGGLSSAGSLSTSPAAGGGMSLLSRLRQSSSGQAGLLTPQPAPHPAPGAPPPPPPPPPVPYTAYAAAAAMPRHPQPRGLWSSCAAAWA